MSRGGSAPPWGGALAGCAVRARQAETRTARAVRERAPRLGPAPLGMARPATAAERPTGAPRRPPSGAGATSWPPPAAPSGGPVRAAADEVVVAVTQQVAMAALAARPGGDAAVADLGLPPQRVAVATDVGAVRELAGAGAPRRPTLPAWRIQRRHSRPRCSGPGTPRQAATASWSLLDRRPPGRRPACPDDHGDSTSRGQGPMQFLPSTWAIYGPGGDIHDDQDAILGAARSWPPRGPRTTRTGPSSATTRRPGTLGRWPPSPPMAADDRALRRLPRLGGPLPDHPRRRVAAPRLRGRRRAPVTMATWASPGL